LRSFTYKELTEATEGFKDELGRGAFGGVYKGAIKTGFTNFIAVKKLVLVGETTGGGFETLGGDKTHCFITRTEAYN